MRGCAFITSPQFLQRPVVVPTGSLLNDDLLDLLPLSFVTFHLQSVIACFENDPGVERARLLRVGPWLPPRLEATIYATYGDRQRDSNISQSSDQHGETSTLRSLWPQFLPPARAL